MHASDTDLDGPAFLALLRQGDKRAFERLIRRYHGAFVGTASAIIGSRAQAEEVVQEAWIAVFSGIGRFEGRSSLASWLFAIVLNRARTRATSEKRLVALPVGLDGSEPGERAVPLSAFASDGHWAEPPRLWEELNPERVVAGRQLWTHVQEAIERLPAGQKAVIILRDMEARTAEETCALLGITSENQRVLLHRARGRLRMAIDTLVDGVPSAPAIAAKPAVRRAKGEGGKPVLRQMLARVWRSLQPPRKSFAAAS